MSLVNATLNLHRPIRHWLRTAAVMVALAVPSLAAGADTNDKYAANCLVCHGPDLKGVTDLGVSLVDSPFVAAKSEAELVAFLKAGRMPDDPATVSGRPMPGFSWIPEADLQEIAAFLKSRHAP